MNEDKSRQPCTLLMWSLEAGKKVKRKEDLFSVHGPPKFTTALPALLLRQLSCGAYITMICQNCRRTIFENGFNRLFQSQRVASLGRGRPRFVKTTKPVWHTANSFRTVSVQPTRQFHPGRTSIWSIRTISAAGHPSQTVQHSPLIQSVGTPSMAQSQTRHFSCAPTLLAPRKNKVRSASHLKRKRRHGFLSRIRTREGRMILRRRRAKGRQNLSH